MPNPTFDILGFDMSTTRTAPNVPQPRKSVLSIDAYVPGKSKSDKVPTKYKLSSNETPFGPSPNAIEACKKMAANLELYPDGTAIKLREALASKHNISANQIICGAGSDEILSLLAYAYLGEGDEAIYTRHGFLVYPIAIKAAGATPIIAEETDCKANIDTILSCLSERTKMVFLANPNNPTGTYLPISEIRRLHEGLPPHIMLVLDAAYAEYVLKEDYEAGIDLVKSANNVVMTRTFSKVYGLAALRLGWAFAPSPVIDTLNRIRGPFNVNTPSIETGIAALKDEAFIQKAVEHNALWLDKVTKALEEMGLKVTPSVANFVLIHFPENEAYSAQNADAYLLERGFILRRVSNYGFDNALRMTIGTQDANRAVIAHLSAFLGVSEPEVS